MAWTPRSDTGGGSWAVFYRVLARRATKAAALEQSARPAATLSVTLDSAVLSGQGILVVASPIAFGTADYILSEATAAGTGTLLLSGTASSVLASATATGTSSLRIAGASTVTLAAAATTATATLRIAGSLSRTLGTATLTASNLASLSTPTLSRLSAAGAVPVQFSVDDSDYVAGFFGQLQIATDSGFSSVTQDTGAIFIGGDEWARLDAVLPFNDPSGTYYARFRMLRDNESGTTTVALPSGGSSTFDASAWSNTVSDTIAASVAALATTNGTNKSSMIDIVSGSSNRKWAHNNNDGRLAMVRADRAAATTKVQCAAKVEAYYSGGGTQFHCGMIDGATDMTTPTFSYPGTGSGGTAKKGFLCEAGSGGTQLGVTYNNTSTNYAVGFAWAVGDYVIWTLDKTTKTVKFYAYDASAATLSGLLGTIVVDTDHTPSDDWYFFGGGQKGNSGAPATSDSGTFVPDSSAIRAFDSGFSYYA